MNLNEYFNSPNSLTVTALAAAISIKNPAQIRQWQHGYGGRQPDPANCLAIERATDKKVTRQELRPDDYWLIWPDLKAPRVRRAQPVEQGA